jgi:heme-degrading monooxygenase HmoA
MPISMTQHAPQMPAEAYEQIIAEVQQPLRGSDGFISHAAEITTDGVTVTEVWETRTAQRTRSVAVSAARQRGGRRSAGD